MLKKFFIASAALAAIGPVGVAHANIYAGITGGIGFDTGHFQITQMPSVYSNDGAANFALGGILVGYDYTCDSNAYFGLEAAALYANLNSQSVRLSSDVFGNPQPNVTIKNILRYSIALQLGYKIGNVIPYISFGGTAANFKLNAHNGSGVDYRGLQSNTANSFSNNNMYFTPGAGIKFDLTECLTAAAEYNYLIGPTFCNTYTTNKTGSWNYSEQIREHTVMLKLVYNFK